ncbi:MAG TPA: ATP-binding protein [Kofleriaceae bacterium]|jgi:signal transduction histidine kinase|nr:ATP-binding protein [Kofleriaceae bacterium]
MRKLSRNFILLVSALLAGSILTCGAGMYGLARLDQSFEEVVSADMPRLMTITDLRRQIRVLVVAEHNHILEADPAKARAIEQEIATGEGAAAALLTRYEPYLLPDDAATWRALRADIDAWTELAPRVLALSRAHRVAEATALSKHHSARWEALIKQLIGAADARLRAATTQTRGTSATARVALGLVFGVSVLLGLIAGLFLYRAIRRTVDEVVSLKDRLVAANASLERTVDERTRTIRAILDHVHFGFFLVGRELRITDGYTRSLSALLGRDRLAGERVSECLGFTGDRGADFDMRVEQIFDDLLPEELNCEQVPSRIVRGDRALRIQARAVRDAAGQVSQVLFGVSDVTELEAAERANRDNQIVLRALKDPEPFRRFVVDLNMRFGSVRDAVQAADDPRARRELHTIKGNASCYGMIDLASRAHEIEEHARIELPPVVDLEAELESFLRGNLQLLGIDRKTAAREIYPVSSDELAELERLVGEATDLETLRRALADRIDHIRWLPVRRLLGPLDTQIASLAERRGKDVTLRVVGSDVAVLPSRIGPVLAVLPHMLRNALDHGIEPRGARGDKPAQAAIELVFRDAGDAWQIAVRDDGRGIDVDQLKLRAVELGLVEPTATLSHDELCALIFAPKLSTAAEVSEISGRGEGMAAVADAVAQCNGTISVRSGHNAGTTIRIAIPKPPAQA